MLRNRPVYPVMLDDRLNGNSEYTDTRSCVTRAASGYLADAARDHYYRSLHLRALMLR